MEQKNCRECGTPLRKNRWGLDDCLKCNVENFFNMPSPSKKKKTTLDEDKEEVTVARGGEVEGEVIIVEG